MPTNGFPWVEDKILEALVPSPLDTIQYGDEPDTHQVECLSCGQIQPELDALTTCDGHKVLYAENEIIVNSLSFAQDFPELDPVDRTPRVSIGDPPEPYVPPEELRVYGINTSVEEALAYLQSQNNPPEAGRNYQYLPAPGWKFGPADVRVPSYGPEITAPDVAPAGGAVAVIDDFEVADANPDTGHGQFVAGIVRNLGPRLNVIELNLPLSITPLVWEEILVASRLKAARVAVAGATHRSVNCSFGTYPCGDDIPKIVSRELREMEEANIPVVAAAGNDNNGPDDPLFYPASDLWVVSVGAAGWDPTTQRWWQADFSNKYGVDKWAPGVAIVSTINGTLWQWSGTSFAAPMIAACIAGGSC